MCSRQFHIGSDLYHVAQVGFITSTSETGTECGNDELHLFDVHLGRIGVVVDVGGKCPTSARHVLLAAGSSFANLVPEERSADS